MWLVVEDDSEEVILQWSCLSDPYRFATTRLPLLYITDIVIRFIGYETSPLAPIARKSRNRMLPLHPNLPSPPTTKVLANALYVTN